MKARAFSLIELSVALAISGIIAVAALSVFSMSTRFVTRMQRMTVADENEKLLLSYLVGEVQHAGGTHVRPWNAIAVDDACQEAGTLPDCPQGSDRLTYATSDPGATGSGVCQLLFKGGNLQPGQPGEGDLIEFKTGSEPCCIATQYPKGLKALKGKTVIGALGNSYFAAVVTEATQDPNMCVVRFKTDQVLLRLQRLEPDVKESLYSTSSCQTSDQFTEQEIDDIELQKQQNGTPAPWDCAHAGQQCFSQWNTCQAFVSVAPVLVNTVQLACPNFGAGCAPVDQAIFTMRDLDPLTNPGIQDAERVIVSPGVYDFQVALGYDFAPTDGVVFELPGGSDDEWSGNLPNEAEKTNGCTGGAALCPPFLHVGDFVSKPTDLRMARIGVVTGVNVRDPKYRSTARIMGREETLVGNGIHLRAGESNAAFRSIALFR